MLAVSCWNIEVWWFNVTILLLYFGMTYISKNKPERNQMRLVIYYNLKVENKISKSQIETTCKIIRTVVFKKWMNKFDSNSVANWKKINIYKIIIYSDLFAHYCVADQKLFIKWFYWRKQSRKTFLLFEWSKIYIIYFDTSLKIWYL